MNLMQLCKQPMVLILSVMLMSPEWGHAQVQSIPSSPAQVQDEQDIETLLNTMNEVLDENRKMRQKIELNDGELDKYSRENSGLRSQLKKMQRQHREEGGKDKEELKGLKESLAQLESETDRLRKENDELLAIKEYHENKLPEIMEESAKLKELLENAVLEGEREEYLELIENAQVMAQQSFEELSVTKYQMQGLEDQMSEAYYKLGNVLFDMKDFQNAIKTYESALRVNPMDGWVHHNLGIIYDYYIHDDKRALYHYEQYLQLKPVAEEAHAIRERILELELKKNLKPGQPLRQEFYENYTKEIR